MILIYSQSFIHHVKCFFPANIMTVGLLAQLVEYFTSIADQI